MSATAALALSCSASPSSGTVPLGVKFTSVASGGTGTYGYLWAFGTGATSTEANPNYTYATAGTFNPLLTVTSGSQTKTCSTTVTATRQPVVTAEWNVESSGGAVTSVPVGINCSIANAAVSGTCAAPFAAGSTVVLTVACQSRSDSPVFESGCDSATTNTCTVSATADRTVSLACFYALGVNGGIPMTASVRASVEAPGVRGRVSVDGAGMTALETGVARDVGFTPRGLHRVEAVVDAARGPGLVRFDLTEAGVADGTLRVLGGSVAQLSPGMVVFRISGQAGERVGFAFTTTRRAGPRDGQRQR